MEYNKLFFSEDLYIEYLKTINGVKFTPREIDIIACILYQRSTKAIAQFLSLEGNSIGEKSVETHIGNIRRKIGGNSRDSIITFIEKSDKYNIIYRYYSLIFLQKEFLKFLHTIPLDSYIRSLVIIADESVPTSFISRLKNHLSLFIKNISIVLQDSINLNDSQEEQYKIYISSKGLTSNNINENDTLKKVDNLFNSKSILLYSIPHRDNIKNQFLKQNLVEYIDLLDQKSYYSLFFMILKIFLPNLDSDYIVKIFNNRVEALNFSHPPVTIESKIIKIRKFSIKQLMFILILLIGFIGVIVNHLNITNNIKLQNSITWNLPRQDHVFVGREELLEALENKLYQTESFSNSSHIAINTCTGLGGIGKTQLALKYAHQTQHPYTLKAWFSAENIENLHKRYEEFARTLGYKEIGSIKDDIINYVKRWLAENPGWLIIYDNANNYEEIEPFLPVSGGHIILTTRNRQWPSNFKILNVDLMTEVESVNTIKSLVQHDIEKEMTYVKELVRNLGYLPLALAQAGSYIKQNDITIEQYLILYKKYELELLADKTFPKGLTHNPVAITWNISIDAVAREASQVNELPIAIELLTVCAYLAPDKISRNTLLNWLKFTHQGLTSSYELLLNKQISLMWKYSMINYNDESHISIHRLVQVVLRHHLEEGLGGNNIYKNLNLEWFEFLLKFFIENENDFKLTNSFQQLIETSNKFKSKFKSEYNDTLAELDLVISPVYFNQEKYEEYLNVLNNVNEYLQNKKGSEFLKCKILYLYSAYYRKKGDYKNAERIINNALTSFNQIKMDNVIKEKDKKRLKAKILFNQANITFAKSKQVEIKVKSFEIENSIKVIQEAISLFKEIKDIRDWLRALELYGRLLILTKQGSKIIKEFNKYKNLIEEQADNRTKMLFYLTYSDAYFLNKDYKTAIEYCLKAKKYAAELNLVNEMKNIIIKEEAIKNSV